MKYLSTVILGLLCFGLAVSLFLSKRNNDAQHEKDAETITTASNLLSSSQAEAAAFNGEVITLSNRLETCQSASLTFSNELIEAKAALATAKAGAERQIADLNRQITRQSTQLETEKQEKQASSQRLADLTRQIAELTNQIASAQASLLRANKDYALLENRFRRDVAERVIVERKFNNRTELKAQLENLQLNPSQEVSEDRIREGLNVVVKSNLCYVIAPE
jgi:chromosome segregation ATPase